MKSKNITGWKNAILEVILIVIGISIAFALENWRDQRNLRNEEIEILKEISETLKSDLIDINLNINNYDRSITSAGYIFHAFDNDLPFHDSLIYHFSIQTYNLLFFRNDGPYEVLKSKGFDLITNEKIRLKIIDLYSVKYRVIDQIESDMPQFQSFPYLFEYIKENFKKSSKDNFTDDYMISIEPLNYEIAKHDPQLRLLLEHASFWRQRTIIHYNRTKVVVEELQEQINIEINRLDK